MSGKVCKHCGSSVLMRFGGEDVILCHDCKKYQHWPLKPGQERTFGDPRKMKRGSK